MRFVETLTFAWFSEADSTSESLFIRFIHLEVVAIVHGNVSVTTCAVDAIYAHIGHDLKVIMGKVWFSSAAKFIVARNLRHRLSASDLHVYFFLIDFLSKILLFMLFLITYYKVTVVVCFRC